MKVEESIEVRRPVEEVFDFAADPASWPDWASAFRVIEAASGPELREGDVFRAKATFLGRYVTTDFEVTSRRPPTRFGYRVVRGPVPGECLWHFAEGDGGTRCTFTLQGEPKGTLRLMVPVALPAVRALVRSDLKRLKAILEGRDAE